jgi:hypothetical protein
VKSGGALDIGLREFVALEQQGLARGLGQGVEKAVAEV